MPGCLPAQVLGLLPSSMASGTDTGRGAGSAQGCRPLSSHLAGLQTAFLRLKEPKTTTWRRHCQIIHRWAILPSFYEPCHLHVRIFGADSFLLFPTLCVWAWSSPAQRRRCQRQMSGNAMIFPTWLELLDTSSSNHRRAQCARGAEATCGLGKAKTYLFINFLFLCHARQKSHRQFCRARPET